MARLTLARATALSIGADFAVIAVSIVSTKFIIRGIGAEHFSYVNAISLMLAQLGAVYGGLGTTALRATAEARANGDPASVVATKRTLILFAFLLSVGSAIAYGLLSGLGWVYLFHVKTEDVWSLGAVIPAILTAAVQPMQLGCASVLAGDEDFRRLSAVKFAHGICRGAMGAGVAAATGSLTQLLWAQALMDCLQVLVLLWFSLPRKGATSLKRQPILLIGRSIVGQSATNFINSWLADAEKFAIGMTGRTLALATYNVPANAVSRLSAFGGALAGVLMPRMALLHAQKKSGEMSVLLGVGTRLNVWAMAVGGAPLILFAPEWLTLWLGPEVAKTATTPVQVLLVGAVANAAAVVANATIRATMRSRVLSSLYAIEVVLHVVVVAVCVTSWGLVGAAVAWSVRVLFDSVAHQLLVASLAELRLDWRWLLVVVSSGGLVYLAGSFQSPVARGGFCVAAIGFASLMLLRLADIATLRRPPHLAS